MQVRHIVKMALSTAALRYIAGGKAGGSDSRPRSGQVGRAGDMKFLRMDVHVCVCMYVPIEASMCP